MTNKEKCVDQLAKEAKQAKHRLEETGMRDSVKERKLRTRRLIERGQYWRRQYRGQSR